MTTQYLIFEYLFYGHDKIETNLLTNGGTFVGGNGGTFQEKFFHKYL